MTAYIDATSMTADEVESAMYDAMIEIPQGYTRLSVVASKEGISFAVCGKGVPAMVLLPDGRTWQRVIRAPTN